MKKYQWFLLYLGLILSALVVVLSFVDLILLNAGLPTIIYNKNLMTF